MKEPFITRAAASSTPPCNRPRPAADRVDRCSRPVVAGAVDDPVAIGRSQQEGERAELCSAPSGARSHRVHPAARGVDLERFVAQAERTTALAELRAGRKTSHWMWGLPQVAGSASSTSRTSPRRPGRGAGVPAPRGPRATARDGGARLEDVSAERVLGRSTQSRSSMTLFAHAEHDRVSARCDLDGRGVDGRTARLTGTHREGCARSGRAAGVRLGDDHHTRSSPRSDPQVVPSGDPDINPIDPGEVPDSPDPGDRARRPALAPSGLPMLAS